MSATMTATRPLPLGRLDRDWHRVLVVGFGLSGKAAAQLLLDRGIEVWVVDKRDASEIGAEPFVARGMHLLPGEDAPLPPGVDAVVVSPGVSSRHRMVSAAKLRGLPVVGEIELAFPLLTGPVVAITGSNGKSTTTALTGKLLEAAGFPVVVCGNIGVPLASVVDGPADRVFVVELSSYQLETIKHFKPRAAAILNLSPDHLERHGDLASYAAAKRRITFRQDEGDVLVVNDDDATASATATRARRVAFSRRHPVEDGAWIEGTGDAARVVDAFGQELFRVADVPLPGPHNLENALAAALLAQAMGASPDAIVTGLRAFQALPHRTQRFLEADGVAFVDDSKATNLDSTARALEGFADWSVHLILGGRDKGGDYADIAALVGRKAAGLYLIGEAAQKIADRLGPIVGDRVVLERWETLERAVAAAIAAARPGQTVLLSPACSSFDQFRDFNHRGDEFQRLVREAVARGADGGA
jgi:UDP-N-acetylmuramoylalanine--D-glutamate ligase